MSIRKTLPGFLAAPPRKSPSVQESKNRAHFPGKGHCTISRNREMNQMADLENDGEDKMTPSEKSRLKTRMEQWRLAGERMAKLRRKSPRSVDVGRAILDLEDAFEATRSLPLPESSGFGGNAILASKASRITALLPSKRQILAPQKKPDKPMLRAARLSIFRD